MKEICNIRLSLTFFITNSSHSLFGIPGEPRCKPTSDVFSDVGVQLFTRAEEHLIAWRHHIVVGDAGYWTIGLEWICFCENMNENVRMKTFRMEIFQMKSANEKDTYFQIELHNSWLLWAQGKHQPVEIR